MTEEKRTRRKEARPAEIIAAALEVFADVGFAQAKISDIAKRAGVAKGTVYLYFQTKEELFEAAVRHYIKPVFSEMSQRVQAFPGPASELLRLLIQQIYQHLPRSPERRGIMRILIAEGGRFPQMTEFYYREVIAGAQQLMRGVIQRGIDSGEFRELPASNFPMAVMAPIMLATIWKMSFEQVAPLDLEQLCAAHIDLVLNGLVIRPELEQPAP